MEIFSYSFFRCALGAAFLLALLFSLLSFIVVSRRLSFLALGTEHAAFGAAGLAQILALPAFPVTFVFCIVLTVIAGRRSRASSADAQSSLIFAAAMAGGMVLLALSGRMGRGGAFNLTSFLFGNLLGLDTAFLLFAAAVTALILAALLPALGKIFYLSFDRDAALVSGTPADFWDTLVYASLSAGIVLGMKLVGVLLVSALAVLPASFALLFGRGLKFSMAVSFIYTLFCLYGGLGLSLLFDLPPGAAVVLLAAFIYFCAKYLIFRRATW